VSRCRPWERILHNTATDIVCSVRECVTEVLNYILWTRGIEGTCHDVEKSLQTVIKVFCDKVDELMRPFRFPRQLTRNNNVIERVWSMQESRRKARGAEGRRIPVVRCVNQIGDAGNKLSHQACELASDYTMAYYEDALQGMISNFGLYAVEECLLSKLTTAFEARQTSEAFEKLIMGESDDSLDTAS
ncbi:hypothetical protein LZ31DRAFT_417861, partial [Colletotrichum somersetense]